MSRCTNSAGCARDPDCEDLNCPGRPNPGPCGSCWSSGYCIVPEACAVPERPTQFRPDYGLDGPHSRTRSLAARWLDFLLAAVGLIAFTALCAGLLHALGFID